MRVDPLILSSWDAVGDARALDAITRRLLASDLSGAGIAREARLAAWRCRRAATSLTATAGWLETYAERAEPAR